MAALVGSFGAPAFAEGTIQFLNTPLNKIKYNEIAGGSSVDAPVGTYVGVFYGTSPSSLTLAEPTVRIVTAGLFNGGTAYALPGTSPGESVFLKIGAWYNPAGPTDPHCVTGGIYGESATIQTIALGPTSGPGTVVWQSPSGTSINRAKPFTMGPFTGCPEPSTVAIFALGLGTLALRCRRKPSSPSSGS